jgi:hypothetical protein
VSIRFDGLADAVSRDDAVFICDLNVQSHFLLFLLSLIPNTATMTKH